MKRSSAPGSNADVERPLNIILCDDDYPNTNEADRDSVLHTESCAKPVVLLESDRDRKDPSTVAQSAETKLLAAVQLLPLGRATSTSRR